MKRKAFGVIATFLVMFQMFSPWGIQINKNGVSVKENTVSAAEPLDHGVIALLKEGTKDGQINLTILSDPLYKYDEFEVKVLSGTTVQTEMFKGAPTDKSITRNEVGVVGFDKEGSQARLYLRIDYEIKNSKFKTSMLTDVADPKIAVRVPYYEALNPTNKKDAWNYIGPTNTDITDIEENGTTFISASEASGNNFKLKWGVLSSKSSSTNLILPMPSTLNGADDDSIACTGGLKTLETKKKLRFAQNNKDYPIYEHSCSNLIDITKTLPKKENGVSKYVANFDKTSWYKNISLNFNFPFTGKLHSFYLYNNPDDISTDLRGTCDLEWCFQDFQITKLEAVKDENGAPALAADVSIFLDDKEIDDFNPFEDVGDEPGKLDSKDRPNSWEGWLLEKRVDSRDPSVGGGLSNDKDTSRGFWLIYSKDKNTLSDGIGNREVINLGDYLFGGDKVPISPVVVKKQNGLAFKVLIPAELGKTYYAKLYSYRIDKDNYIKNEKANSTTKSYTMPATVEEITQTARDGAIIENGQEKELVADPAWLPACGLGFWPAEDGSITGCAIQIFYYLVFVPTAYLLAAAGTVLDWILVYAISPTAYKAQYIIDSWKFVRDVCNLFFIFMMIYLAFKLILSIGHHTKQLIINTLIIAAVINFSYPLTTVIIDISNITARQLYYNSFPKEDTLNGKPYGLSSTVSKGYNPQQIVIDGLDKNSNDLKDTKENNKGTIFMILLMGVIFNIIAMIIFLKIALLFIYRILGLVFAIILSPFAVFSFSMDKEQRSKLKMVGFDTWLSGLLQDAFKAPVFLFFMLIMVLFIKHNPFKAAFGSDVNGLEWWASLIIPFMLLVGFLSLIHSVTKSMSSSLAEMAGGVVMKGIGAVAGVAAGGLALAGSGLIGKGMTKLAGSGMGQRIMDRAATGKGLGGFIARQQTKAIRGMQAGSFDLRQNGVANAVSKATGMNFNLGASMIGLGTAKTAGGYVGKIERVNKKREEFAQMLEWNKKLADDLKNKKQDKDKEKEDAETLAKDQKAALSQSERELTSLEKNKKDADDVVAELQTLEDLIAKRNDLDTRGEPTNETDVKIGRLEQKLGGAVGSLSTARTITDNNGNQIASRGTSAAFTIMRNGAVADREQKKAEVADKKTVVEDAKNELKGTEDSIRSLDKEIKALTKAIENVKNNRKNGYAHMIRNKSGHIFNKDTYTEKYDHHGHRTQISAEERQKFESTFGNLSGQMENIITRVDEHSHTANNAFKAKVLSVNTALGALVGAFTGGAGAIALGAGAGGIVGIARTYQPGNEHYGVAHDPAAWHPHPHDNYHPPTGGGGGGGGGGGHDSHGH